ncbi:MFS transporter [Burkholderia anthina]|uniref:MFS transporter n=1 Tax=Burkholderia anthina TaxID=179879 RepID=UPI00158C3852|nr:MFS transporter [Burkholderia anthina]
MQAATTKLASQSAEITSDFEKKTLATVSKRIMTFLFICYMFAFLDRVNIGFAKLHMQDDLQFSEAIFGFGAAIFFIAYFMLEVPSNIALNKFGARRWIARIMVTWGVLSIATAFVTTPTQFYVIRALLGAAEAGFFPGVMLYLTYWFPIRNRARAITIFLMAIPFSVLIGGPLSGWILHFFHDYPNFKSWQYLFIIEGVPSILLGVICWFYLDDSVDKAKWLNAEQKAYLKSRLDSDSSTAITHSFWAAARMPQIWLMTLTNFALLSSIALILWLPSLFKNAGVTNEIEIGWYTGIPYGFAMVAMFLTAKSSDRTGERRWHTAIPAIIASFGTVMIAMSLHNPTLLAVGAVISLGGLLTLNALFWSLPTTFLTGTAAVVGIAFINTVGQLAGVTSPAVFGWLFSKTGSPATGILVLAAVYFIGGIAALLVPKADVDR